MTEGSWGHQDTLPMQEGKIKASVWEDGGKGGRGGKNGSLFLTNYTEKTYVKCGPTDFTCSM